MVGDGVCGCRSGRTLVMGIGNLLLGDEGVGVHAVRLLSDAELPGTVDVMDAGTSFMEAVDRMGRVQNLVIIDAVKGGGKPGTVYRIPVNPESRKEASACLHSMSVISTLQFSVGGLPETVSVIGVEPEVIDWTMELSDPVTRAMPLLIDTVLAEIERCRGVSMNEMPDARNNPNKIRRAQ